MSPLSLSFFKLAFCSCIVALCPAVYPAPPQWAWQRGDQSQNFQPIFGTAGVPAPANRPGGRSDSAICADKSGHLWLFGGYGYNDKNERYYLNDLWRYDIATNQWTWFKGSRADADGAYGTRGKADPANVPPCRSLPVLWVGGDSKIWLFGGIHWYYANTPNASDIIELSDLWCFDPATRQWRWVKGPAHQEISSIHDLPGVESETNVPGAGLDHKGFVDSQGRLWLVGGYFLGSTYCRETWLFNTRTERWTWMGGEITAAQSGGGATTLQAPSSNHDQALPARATGTASPDKFYLYGESRTDVLWCCGQTPTGVKWERLSGSGAKDKRPVHGTKDVPAPGNTPGSRYHAVVWPDDSGHVWLFGGEAYDHSDGSLSMPEVLVDMNDLWRFDLATKQWCWLAGSNLPSQPSTAGRLGVPGGYPSARDAVGCRDGSGTLWLFGGDAPPTSSTHSIAMNDLWRLDPARLQWTWMHGDFAPQEGKYVKQGAASQTYYPMARQAMGTGVDKTGRLYLLGGETMGYYSTDSTSISSKHMNDLWRYDPRDGKWTWLKGCSSPKVQWEQPLPGISAPENTTDPVRSMALWIDHKDRIWKFGGYSSHDISNGIVIYPSLTGLWRHDPDSGNWTSITNLPYGPYDPTQIPAIRGEAATWTGRDGKLWLLGGVMSKLNLKNDLWSLDPETTSWTLVRGNGDLRQCNQSGSYGRKGLPAATNLPGARRNAATWTDRHGNLWLFGGWGVGAAGLISGMLNDLWYFNPATANWTWVSGATAVNPAGNYGKLGVAAASNAPPGRVGATAWVDDAGRFWIFGGGTTPSQTMKPMQYFNDLWQFDPLTGLWTWCGGSSKLNQLGTPGSPGEFGAASIPGARVNSGAFSDGQGNFYLFGGYGYNDLGFCGPLNDFWKFSPGLIKNAVDANAWSRLN